MTDEPEPPEDTDDQELPRRGADDAPLVERVRAGDPDAFGVLYDRWFDRVSDLAYRILRDTDAAADVAQDTFLSAWRNLDGLRDPQVFGGWLLRIARNNALNRQRKDQRAQPVDDERLAVIERTHTRPEDRLGGLADPAHVAEDAALVALLWDAARALGERDCEVLDLHLRHGLDPAEIAEVTGLQRNAANQLVHRVKQRLGGAVRARVLWRDGVPACAELRAVLAGAGVEVFGAEAVRVIGRHSGGCDACSERERTHLSPTAMFAAAPIIVLPALKVKVAAALAAQGVPMTGSTASAHDGENGDGENGDGESSDGENGDGDAHPTGRRGRIRRLALAGAIVVAVILGVIVLGASGLHDDANVAIDLAAEQGSTPDAGGFVTTAPSSPPTTTAVSTTTATAAATTGTGGPAAAIVVPPTAPPATVPAASVTTSPPVIITTTTTIGGTATTAPTPPVAPPIVRFVLAPTTIRRGYSMAGSASPHLTWGVVGAPGAHVFGKGVDIAAVDGQIVPCPAPPVRAACVAPAGDYVYVLDATDANGAVVAHREVTLTIQ